MLSQFISNGLITGITIALLAVGFSILYSNSRFFVFTYGISYTWAAYTSLLLRDYLPHLLATIIGVLVAAVVGILLEAFVFRPVRKRGDSALVLMLMSIGAYTVLQNVVSLFFGDGIRSVRSWPAREGYSILGARVTPIQLLIVSVSIAALMLSWLLLECTSLGRRLRAVANDADLAHAVGINVGQSILLATMLGSILAGVAGILISFDTDLIPTMGFQALLLGVVASIVGGMGNIKGVVAGSMFLGLAQHLAIWGISTQWQDAVVFLILIFFLILRPQGFFGRPLRQKTV